MKKLLIIAVVALVSLSAMAQKNTPEAKAEKVSKEMQEVLELDQTKYESVYSILLERMQKTAELKKETGDDKEAFKIKNKQVMKTAQVQLKETVGAENLKKWQIHVKAKKK
ncbi:hypothetical protein E9993_19785 [Labilibacter sediminis]|nr:hypothetical protein E9993_19785 [Labilibacter sediminis]